MSHKIPPFSEVIDAEANQFGDRVALEVTAHCRATWVFKLPRPLALLLHEQLGSVLGRWKEPEPEAVQSSL